jgi:hypothetical protein
MVTRVKTALRQVNMGANGFDRMVDGQVACPGRRLAWLIIRHLILKWQLTVAHGSLKRLPVLSDRACGFDMGANQ